MVEVLLVAGARPNFMKVKPVLDALEARSVSTMLVHTGQHYDERMSDVFFDDLGMRRPDRSLGVGSGSHATQTAAVMTGIEAVIDEVRPTHLVVPGDVNSTLAAAIVAAKAGVVVSHIEAGLRSRDWAMPEEVNRVVADRVSDLLLAPSEDAVENLREEGYREDQIHLVGNVMVDTLLANVDRARQRSALQELSLEPGGYGAVTLHRPSNVDDPASLTTLLETLGQVAERIPLVLPAHPRAAERMRQANRSDRLRIIEPLGYLDFLALQAGAALVLTDSGGIQEETTVLGVPCLTLRENTERPITITEGTNRLVGRDPDAILTAADDALAGRFPKRRPERWDGKAGERIADVLTSINPATLKRPTDR